ncbi:MAG: hypothetical protein EOP84_08280 [Verrucomicrobiaceae bacterium]|nr:MAG: hypothetical protein EOP84_08280 [Verrucomicrobiaceae bacterium]
MSASNDNWVCFVCRTSRREPKIAKVRPTCHDCGADCFCIGSKVEVPKREAVKEWGELQAECQRRLDFWHQYSRVREVRRQHSLEKEIARMEALPLNIDRTRQIRALREDLARLLASRPES